MSRKKHPIIYSYVTDELWCGEQRKMRFTTDPVHGVSEAREAPKTKAKVAYVHNADRVEFWEMYPSCHSKAPTHEFDAACITDDALEIEARTINWLVGNLDPEPKR